MKSFLLNTINLVAAIGLLGGMSANLQASDAYQGYSLYNQTCFLCHGEDGKGMTELGAPNLTDQIWLFGGSRSAIQESIRNSRAGVMPFWQGRLSPETIKQLAVYIHSLGGGQ